LRFQKDRRRAHRCALVRFVLVDHLGDPVDDVVVAVEQDAAVQDAEKLGPFEDWNGADHHHAAVLLRLRAGPGARSVLERQEGLFREAVALQLQLVLREHLDAEGRLALEGARDGRVLQPVIADIVGWGGPQNNLPVGRNNGDEVEPETPLDHAEALLKVFRRPQLVERRIHNGLLDRDEVDDGLDLVQLGAVDGTGAAEVEADLLLRLANHAALDDPQPEEGG
jgi:hypothetical protein